MAMNDKQRTRLSFALWFFMFMLICGAYVGKYEKPERELNVDEGRWSKLMLVLDQIEKSYVDTIDYNRMVEELLPQVMEKLLCALLWQMQKQGPERPID